MAWYWDLAACFDTKDEATVFQTFFEGKTILLSDNSSVELKISLHESGKFWVVGIWPVGMSYGSPLGNRYELTNAPLHDEIRDWMYGQLKARPKYRYAMFGAEAEDYFLTEDLKADFQDPAFGPKAGMIVRDDIIKEWNIREEMDPFCEGYSWVPF